MVASMVDQRVDAGDEANVGFLRCLERTQCVEVIREEQTVAVDRHKTERFDSRFRRFHAEAREPLKLSHRRRADPSNVAPCQFDEHLFIGDLQRLQIP